MDEGERVPDVELTLDDGRRTRLSEFLGDGPLVVFFYPRAFTGGCTAQSCHFREVSGDFATLGAGRLGVSRDDVATQHRFRTEHDLDYPLVADEDGTVADAFGAKRLGPLPSKRRTYVLDEDGTVLRVIASELNMQVHADEALDVLRSRAAS